MYHRPFSRFGLVPIGGRSTAVKLSDGGVWVLASTPLTEETKKTLDNLGPVKYVTHVTRLSLVVRLMFGCVGISLDRILCIICSLVSLTTLWSSARPWSDCGGCVLGDFKKAYPDAKLIAPEAAIERFEDKTLKVDGSESLLFSSRVNCALNWVYGRVRR